MHTPHLSLDSSSPVPTTSSPPADGPVPHTSHRGHDIGLLALRLLLGLAIAAHGAQKLFGWFGGKGLDGTGQFFASLGYPSGRSMAVVGGLSELLGGLGLAFGLLIPLASAAVIGMMINASVSTWDGVFLAPEGVEYSVVAAAAAACLALAGPGRYAVDQLLPVLRAHRLAHGVAAVLLGCVTAAAVLLIRS